MVLSDRNARVERVTESSTKLRRDALVRSVCARLQDDRRTEDEIRVVDDVLCGLEHGAEVVGPLDLERDERNFDEEAAQECRDLLAYLAMQKVAKQHRARERLRCEAADEIAGFLGVEAGLVELRDSQPIVKAHAFDITDLDDAGGEG